MSPQFPKLLTRLGTVLVAFAGITQKEIDPTVKLLLSRFGIDQLLGIGALQLRMSARKPVHLQELDLEFPVGEVATQLTRAHVAEQPADVQDDLSCWLELRVIEQGPYVDVVQHSFDLRLVSLAAGHPVLVIGRIGRLQQNAIIMHVAVWPRTSSERLLLKLS